MIDWNKYPNFAESEFRCRCSCGGAVMDKDFIDLLQKMRTTLGFPFHITSGYRCPDYNASVSNTGLDGPHTTGRAADIACNGADAWRLLAEAVIHGVYRLGVAQKGERRTRFLHLDLSTAHPGPTIWSY